MLSIEDVHRRPLEVVLGNKQYLVNHTHFLEEPALLLSLATDADREGRESGESRPNPEGHEVSPRDLILTISFANIQGLLALEHQLQQLRDTHFPQVDL